jgi:hypothetical protein
MTQKVDYSLLGYNTRYRYRTKQHYTTLMNYSMTQRKQEGILTNFILNFATILTIATIFIMLTITLSTYSVPICITADLFKPS